MISAAPHNLVAQVAVMPLACPAKHVIIVSNLLMNSTWEYRKLLVLTEEQSFNRENWIR